MAKGDSLQERLVQFAVDIIRLVGLLPKNYAGRHIAEQLLRSGTSPAPNYAEARGGESRRDFIHKLKISLKELNETCVWLAIIQRSAMLPAEKVSPVEAECQELCRIIGASIQTAQKRMND